jgi:hypothetical protein
MAEQILSQKTSFNQFKARNIINSATITSTTDTNISPNVMKMVMDASNVLYNLTSSFSQISQSLDTQNKQIEDLSLTSNALNSNKIFVNKEIPSGNIDGINTKYTLLNSPTQGSDHLYLNGLLIEDGPYSDYQITESTIIFPEPLLPGMKLSCTYYYWDYTPIKIFKDKEIPSGSIDGINKIFTLRYSPIENSEHVYINGLLQESGINNDYTISDSIITFKEAPLQNVKLRCTYYHVL